ncbi:MAG TPA: cobalamin biosynthesis protein, partial [Nitrosopumilaceae archaeon]|nr:cobalamin biosynthesis protein [Nitrosopumilaceae archaeon]
MILIPVLAVLFALSIDFAFGDTKNKFHPTVWVGMLIGKLVLLFKNNNPTIEKIGGLILTISVTSIVASIFYFLNVTLHYLNQYDFSFILGIVTLIFSIVVTGYLLKTTIAIKGMEKHATLIMRALSHDDINDARVKLS